MAHSGTAWIIGRESAIRGGFSPVIYQLQQSPVVRSLLEVIDSLDIVGALEPGYEFDPDKEEIVPPNETYEQRMSRTKQFGIASARLHAAMVASFVKTFEPGEFG